MLSRTVGRRGEAEKARCPVDILPAERARGLQAKQDRGAPQAAVEHTGMYSLRVLESIIVPPTQK